MIYYKILPVYDGFFYKSVTYKVVDNNNVCVYIGDINECEYVKNKLNAIAATDSVCT